MNRRERELRALMSELVAGRGIAVNIKMRRTGHYRVEMTKGDARRVIAASGSPSCVRTAENFRHQVRRVLETLPSC